MKARPLTFALIAGLLALSASPAAFAQDAPSDEEIREQLDECLEGGPYPYGPPTCTFDGEGNLVDRDVPGEGGSSPFGGLVVLGLLWSLVPMVIAASIAKSRGVSVGIALLITLVFGWLGLLFLYLVRDGSISLRAGGSEEPRVATGAADEIRKLGELRREGLLTDEEFEAQKARLLARS